MSTNLSNIKCMELYNKITDPLSDVELIKKLIYLYTNTSSIEDFYIQLINTTKKDYNPKSYKQEEQDFFYSALFNSWKRMILNLTSPQIMSLIKQKYDYCFLDLIDFLATVPDVKTKKEVMNVFNQKHNKPELQTAINKYKLAPFGINDSFLHVISYYTNPMQNKPIKTEHRLYLNAESIDIYTIADYFIKKCIKRNLPYYFKFDEYINRDDNFVIFSSTENLMHYIEILQEMKYEMPNVVSRLKSPTLLSGKINEYIGYGAEPNKSDINNSFNFIRTICIMSAIDISTKNWVLNNRNLPINHNNNIIAFQDYIVEKTIENLSHKAKNCKTNFLNYTKEDLESFVLKNKVHKLIDSQLENLLSPSSNKSNNNFSFDKHVYDSLEEVLRKISLDIVYIDPNFINKVQMQIKNIAEAYYEIDKENFCGNIAQVKMMSEFDEKNLKI